MRWWLITKQAKYINFLFYRFQFFIKICCNCFCFFVVRLNFCVYNFITRNTELSIILRRRVIRMIPSSSVCLLTNVHGINQQYKLGQKLYLIDLFKLFVACTSWKILTHHWNHIFDCHLTGIWESSQDTI